MLATEGNLELVRKMAGETFTVECFQYRMISGMLPAGCNR